MRKDELKALFDQQASSYDRQWAKMAPINTCLHYLVESVFAELPTDARILCVGAGTGKELLHLAKEFLRWEFTVVEPSGAMLDVCRHRVDEAGFTSRCYFHEGYLDSLPATDMHHGATCFLVSQFILDREDRAEFFHAIAKRLQPQGILVSSDLASDVGSGSYEALLHAWLNMMASAGIPPEGLDRMRDAYSKDVAILPPNAIAAIIESGGFETPVQFFQAGLIHAWFSKAGLRRS